MLAWENRRSDDGPIDRPAPWRFVLDRRRRSRSLVMSLADRAARGPFREEAAPLFIGLA